MPEKERREEVSRRNFLKSAGFIVGGAATSLGMSSVLLTGCVDNPNCQAYSEANPVQTSAKVDKEYFGECVCPGCYISIPHPRGVPCRTISCPKCGTFMARAAI